MKLVTERAIEKFEEDFNCLVTSDMFDLTLNLLWLNDTDFKSGQEALTKAGIVFTKGAALRTCLVKQSKLEGIVEMAEQRVWLSAKGQRATLTAEMDHQRLSNAIGLLELMLKKGKLSKEQGNDYLLKLNESIVPELEERFKGELLPYCPYFGWEKDLINLPDV